MTIRGLTQGLDSIAGIIGLLVGTAIVILFPTQRDMGVVILLGCATYLIFKNKLGTSGLASLRLNYRQNRLLNIAFWCLFTASIWLYQTQPLYHRPLAYFILISLLAGIIAIEILCFEKNNGKIQVWPILLKIVLLSLSIRVGIFYEFPSLSGADAFFHARHIQYIADTGFVAPYEIAGKYCLYPVFHLPVAMIKVLTSLGLKEALFWSIGLNVIIGTVLIYFVGQKIAGHKVGLLAVLLANVAVDLIIEGVSNIFPGTLVTSFFMLMLYLIVRQETGVRREVILFALIALIVFTHTLNTFVVMLSLIFVYLASRGGSLLLHYQRHVRLPAYFLLISVLILFLSWGRSYGPGAISFFDRMLNELSYVLSALEFGSETTVTIATYFGMWTNTLFHLGYLVVLFFAVGGMLWWLSSRDDWKFSIAGATIVLYTWVYGVPAVGMRSLITGRWIAIFFPFIAILAAEYMIRLIQLMKPNLSRIVIFGMATLITFLMITTSYVNKDNPIFARERMHRDQYMASEVSAVSTLNAAYSGIIRTDGSYTSGIMRQLEMNSVTELFDTEYISNAGEREESGTLIIIRECIFEETVRIIVPGQIYDTRRTVDQEFLERFKSSDYDLVYANGQVTGYISK